MRLLSVCIQFLYIIYVLIFVLYCTRLIFFISKRSIETNRCITLDGKSLANVSYPDNILFYPLPYCKTFQLFLFQLTLGHQLTIIRTTFQSGDNYNNNKLDFHATTSRLIIIAVELRFAIPRH